MILIWSHIIIFLIWQYSVYRTGIHVQKGFFFNQSWGKSKKFLLCDFNGQKGEKSFKNFSASILTWKFSKFMDIARCRLRLSGEFEDLSSVWTPGLWYLDKLEYINISILKNIVSIELTSDGHEDIRWVSLQA